MKQVFEVDIIRDKEAQTQKVIREYYVATHISHVIEKLKLELADSRAEVVKIHAVAPVLAIID